MSFNLIPAYYVIVCILANKCSAVAKMGDRLATIDMGQKLGEVAVPLFGCVELGPHVTQCRLSEAYVRTKWHLDPSSRLATTDIGRKLEGCASFFGTGAGYPSNTMSLGPRPTSIPSGILILPAGWPQQIWAENWGRTVPLWGRDNWVSI